MIKFYIIETEREEPVGLLSKEANRYKEYAHVHTYYNYSLDYTQHDSN